MTTKEQVSKILERLPEDCTLEDIQYQLYVMALIQRRLELAEHGEVVSQTEAERRLEKWLAQ